jgi:hypothetical protein
MVLRQFSLLQAHMVQRQFALLQVHMNLQFKLVISQTQVHTILQLKSMALQVHTNLQLKLEGNKKIGKIMEIRIMHP